MNRDAHIECNQYYHVYNRGNNRQTIFRDDADYIAFVKKMKSAADKYLIEIPVYALMPNHYHFIALQKLGGSSSNMMGALATSAVKRYNLKYHRIGHLFQGPFRNIPMSDEALWDIACYIHLNPIRANMVVEPGDWESSNFADLCKRFPSTQVESEKKETFNSVGKRFPSARVESEEKEIFSSVWHGYSSYVYEILNNEREEKLFWKRVLPHLEEGFLRPS